MRTTIIPAQITTVEDRVAGDFSLSQILILMVPVFGSAIIYILFYPSMKMVLYKIGLIIGLIILFGILALRIKGKIVAMWLFDLVRFQLRPKYYVFDKNESFGRQIDLSQIVKSQIAKKTKVKKEREIELKLLEIIRLEEMVASGKVALRYQFNKKAYEK